jgi:hypothetical protein
MSYAEQMQRIACHYREAGEPWPATTRQIAAWAIRTHRWAPQSSTLIDRCARDLADALRVEYMTDPQGRRVRAMHAATLRDATGEQKTFWADIRTATVEHMEVAFQQRRRQIVADCHQLKVDMDSYNQNARPAAQIQLIFDFTDDLAEIEAAEAHRGWKPAA